MLNFLYTILIYPVYMFVDFMLFAADTLTRGNIGVSIVILSVCINLVCLPMYNMAEKLQEKERDVQAGMKSMIDRIKAVFKGDEQYMILSAYYREKGYRPVYALRAMFPLFIQIPFFMAAYSILSSLPALRFTSFLCFNDLSLPDGLLHIGAIQINIMPIVMTAVNIAASAVYTKDLAIKDKAQLYVIAFIFLALLYNSSSGLVLYWTLNNVFSLVKNIFYRIKLKPKTWYKITVVALICLTIITAILTRPTLSDRRKPVMIMTFLTIIAALIPFMLKILRSLDEKFPQTIFDDNKKRFFVFLLSAASLAVFAGLTLPSAVIASSPQEFSNFDGFKNPLGILYYSFTQSLGCLFWFICLYKLFSGTVQKHLARLSVVVLVCALINVFLFKGNYGDISNTLIFENEAMLKSSMKYFALNIFTLGAGCVITLIILYSNLSRFMPSITGILLLSFFASVGISSVSIQKEYLYLTKIKAVDSNINQKAYRVSKTGKNIFIFMLDRGVNFFIEPIFENSEIVRNAYTGFTLFENSVTFTTGTVGSTPSLFGGYEYTPENINKRSDEFLVDKHNEALSVLPRLFSEHGWFVSFTDPSWLNYSYIYDLSPFKKYNMIAQNTSEKYREYSVDRLSSNNKDGNGITGLRRNMLYFAYFRILPSELRRIFYLGGRGHYAGNTPMQDIKLPFIKAYNALTKLTDEVNFIESGNCLNIIVNETTHEPILAEDMVTLHKDFLVQLAKKYCLNKYTEEHFYVNYLTHEELAKFFTFLKENNCYDNSRIIIVSDHGRYGMEMNGMTWLPKFENAGFDVQWAIPLIMIKDFDAHGELKKDNRFMTIADTPILAVANLPEELQVNPFSGKTFKETQDKKIVKTMHGIFWDATKQRNLTRFAQVQDLWAYVHDNVYDPDNWSWGRTKRE
ncbi:MAG: membrane protein insertase YidC [Treponema sp.]